MTDDPLAGLEHIEEDAPLRSEEEVPEVVEPFYVLNRNEGTDTIHRNPREECNTDDSEGRQAIDGETADALLTLGHAVRCGHCFEEEG